MPEETATAIVGIGGMKDLISEEESQQELSLVNNEEIKVIEKDDQKTGIPEIVKGNEIKDLMPDSEITKTPSLEVASENPSDIPSLDDTKYSNETESEVTEIVESVDLKKIDPAEKPEELGEEVSSEISEELANQLFHTTLATVTDDQVYEESVTPGTDHEVSENEVTPDDEIQQVEVETQSEDVIKGEDIKTGYKKTDKSKPMIFNGQIYRKYFISSSAYFLSMWLMRSPKNFEKIANLKI